MKKIFMMLLIAAGVQASSLRVLLVDGTGPTTGLGHSSLDELNWTQSGHTGTPQRVSVFNSGGFADEGALGSNLEWSGTTINVSSAASFASVTATGDVTAGGASLTNALPKSGGTMTGNIIMGTNVIAGESLTTSNIVVSGFGEVKANGTYTPNGTLNGKTKYINSTTEIQWLDYQGPTNPYEWVILSGGVTVFYASESDTLTPALASGWYWVSGSKTIGTVSSELDDRIDVSNTTLYGDWTTTGNHTIASNLTATTYSLTDNRLTIPSSLSITNDYTIASSAGAYRHFSIDTTNEVVFTVTGAGSNYYTTVDALFSNYTNSVLVAFTNETGSLEWVNEAPTGGTARVFLDWIGTDVRLINTTP